VAVDTDLSLLRVASLSFDIDILLSFRGVAQRRTRNPEIVSARFRVSALRRIPE
jgi:hypothetical protein